MPRNSFHAFDIIGNIALVKFPRKTKSREKKKFAVRILKENKSVKTVLEKVGKFMGRLRKQKTRWILGLRTKEVLYKENGCVFRFNVDSSYFSPRLSNERKEIAGLIKKNDDVLVMFSGVNPYGIVIAKNSKAKKVVSVEINREATKYAKMNVQLNNLKGRVEIVQGDVKKIAQRLSRQLATPLSYGALREVARQSPDHSPQKIVNKKSYNLNKIPTKYDVIIMPRPQLKESFLKEAFMLSKKGTRVFYYDFCKQDEVDFILEKIKTEAEKSRKKIKILRIKNAGEIGVRKIRIRIDFVVS